MAYHGNAGYTRQKIRYSIEAIHALVADVRAHVPKTLTIDVPDGSTHPVHDLLLWNSKNAFRQSVVAFLDMCDLLETLNDESPLLEKLVAGTREQLKEWLDEVEGSALDREGDGQEPDGSFE